MLQKAGNVYFSLDKPINPTKDECGPDRLGEKVLICLMVFPNPQLTWKHNEDIVISIHRKLDLLTDFGVLNQEFFNAVQGYKEGVFIAAEFSDLATAEKVFDQITDVSLGDDRVVDVYLCHLGQFLQSLD